jgi:putative DNA primase/helicase
MSAQHLAKALGGRKAGAAWMARCPAHDDREPSLPITEGENGKMLVRCHAGCDQRDVIEALRSRGLCENAGRYGGRSRNWIHGPPRAKACPHAQEHIDAALRIWRASRPADG